MTRPILVVDDEPFNVDLLIQELEDLGHTAIGAADGRAALDLLEKQDFDAVLLDVMMPEMDGIEVLETLQKDGRLSQLPVIVVSALTDMTSVRRCIELGAEDYLFKPIDERLLQARLTGTLEKKALRDQVAQQLDVIKSIFGKYVSSEVAETILADPGQLAPVECEASIMFCDIEGFTEISEKLTPVGVLDLLTDFYTAVLAPVERNRGIVNEFLGDGMLVTFNAPIQHPNYARAAVQTAHEILEILETQKFHGMSMSARIGIATGKIVSGNISARNRLNYTVLGDTVNLAARLEAENKSTNSKLLICENTIRQLDDAKGFDALEIKVRGKSHAVTAFRFVGAK
ncbi:MAG: response regulator [Planctomycetales bacterium]